MGRTGATGGWRRDAAILVAFALVSILLTWPVAARISTQIAGDPHDSLYTLYALSWNYRVIGGTGSFWNANIFYPHQGVLFYGDPLFGLTLIGAPIRLLTKNPVALFNLLFLLSFFLCAAGAYALTNRLTGSRPAAFLAGLIFAFCPYRFAHIGHLEILYFAWIPFTLLFMHRFFHRPTWGDAFGMAAFYILQVLSCAYYGAFFTFFAAVFAVYSLAKTGRWRQGRFWVRAAVAASLVGACLTPYILPFLRVHARMHFIRPPWEVEFYSAQLQHYLAVPPWNHVWGGLFGRLGGVEWQLFPGLAAIVLTAWGLARLARKASSLALPPPTDRYRVFFALWNGINAALLLIVGFLAIRPTFSSTLAGFKLSGRRIEDPLSLLILSFAGLLVADRRFRGRLARLVRTASAPARCFAAAGAAAWLLSFGPSIRIFGRKILTGPYAWVYKWLPGFQSLRAASRFSVLVILCLAIFSAYALADWLRSRPGGRRIWIVAGLAVLVLFESWSGPLPMSSIPLGSGVPAIYRAVAALPDDASLVEIPMPTRDDEEWKDAWPVYYSTFHWKHLVNGYSGYAPPAYRIVREAMEGFPNMESLDLLESLQVGYVLAHVGAMPADRRALFLRRMVKHRSRADPVAEADGSILYRILPWAANHDPGDPALHSVGDKSIWRGRASLNAASIGLAFDGRPETYWSTGFPQQRGDFVRIDLGRIESFRQIVLRQQNRPLSYPRNFDVETSLDGVVWTRLDFGRNYFPILKKSEVEDLSMVRSVVSRVQAKARFLRITLTESHPSGHHWAIAEIDLLDE